MTVRSSHELPADLAQRLRRARAIEQLAETEDQYRRAVYATTTLLKAAANAGWRLTDLAPPLGISASTVSKRIRDARTAGREHPTGLVVDGPPAKQGAPTKLGASNDDGDWLTRAEAAELLGVAVRTVQDYVNDGLLPNRRRLTGTRRVYSRADVERIRLAGRRGKYPDRAALRRAIDRRGSSIS